MNFQLKDIFFYFSPSPRNLFASPKQEISYFTTDHNLDIIEISKFMNESV